jgi:predicted site-specific integrase-resolvase
MKGVCRQTVYNWIASGKIKLKMCCGKKMVDEKQKAQWLNTGKA